MSAFLAGSPLVAKVTAKQVARRNVTVRAAAPNDAAVTRRAAVAGVLAFFLAAKPANAVTTRVRAKSPAAAEPGVKTGNKAKNKPGTAPHSRTPFADKQAEIAKAYGLERLPGQ